MKRLRPSIEEKTKLIEDITEKLAWYNRGTIEDFSIDDLIKEYAKVPKDVKKPTIQVNAEAYIKMLELVNQSAVECSWHGLVRRTEDTYYVYDILVFPQINSPTTTTTDEHGHSHVNMNVFSSGVDDKYQKDLITKVDDGDYYIFFIMNKKMEICIFLYDFNQQIMFEKSDINFQIVNDKCEDLKAWAGKQLKDYTITATQNKYKKGFSLFDDKDDISYFGSVKPIFKGAKNGFK